MKQNRYNKPTRIDWKEVFERTQKERERRYKLQTPISKTPFPAFPPMTRLGEKEGLLATMKYALACKRWEQKNIKELQQLKQKYAERNPAKDSIDGYRIALIDEILVEE